MPKQTDESQSRAVSAPTQGARRATGVGADPARAAESPAPDPEVVEKATRRRFSAEYKRAVLQQADRCAPGELVALLRREGLYSSHLTTWRRQREAGELEGLTPRKRGRKAQAHSAQQRRVAELERENARLREQLLQAETIIDVQKKLSTLLDLAPATREQPERR